MNQIIRFGEFNQTAALILCNEVSHILIFRNTNDLQIADLRKTPRYASSHGGMKICELRLINTVYRFDQNLVFTVRNGLRQAFLSNECQNQKHSPHPPLTLEYSRHKIRRKATSIKN